ncbi:hypothetical protein [Gilliamella sp. GillExp13]|uniref:hypothetical protein n=1 Tax=Gilliamella sp. GillExp13 TaxID=3120243 RepID=UPI00080DB1B4|nr:hypothetical protein [Gilliamella apicola]OCG58744.1 hypothetical protein A9G37_06535 [Gilliamella apicola]
MTKQEEIRKLQQQASFDVSDFIWDEEDRLYAKIDFDELTALLLRMMNVDEIDGEELHECVCRLTHKQAFIEAKKKIENNEQMLIDQAC